MDVLLLPLPLFLAFEFWQLVNAERYLGIAQIEQGTDPRRLELPTWRAALWTTGIVAIWLWSLLLLALLPWSRWAAVSMLLVSVCGLSVRRNVSMKWILVSLTFEGAIRIGMMLFMAASVLRTLLR